MPRRVPAWALLLVVAASALQGVYASYLNRLYYQHYAPFFDSMAYLNQMADVLAASKSGGILAGLQAALGESTVSLPWIIAALFGPVVPYSRLVGVWIQEIWMAALGVSLLIYWRKYRGAPIGMALLWTAPPISFTAVYRVNAGVSDFRMDLSLYLLFALVVIWYLATRETEARTPWILSGIFICLCCLNRATAPAYLGVALGPVLAARWWMEPTNRGRLVRRVLVYWLPAALIGLLPVIKNWRYVHYYYFIWGADPNAHLPLRQSAMHFYLAARNMGFIVMAAAALLLAAQLVSRKLTSKGWDLDWTLLWICFAPVLLLTATGAGLNPFVSMPTVFGGFLCCFAPFRSESPPSRPVMAISALLALLCIGQVRGGYMDHLGKMDGNTASMAALKDGIHLMQSESARMGLRRAQFLTAHLSDFQATALRNVLIYDTGAVPVDGAYKLPDGLVLVTGHESLFSAAVLVAWNEVPGASDADRFRHLASLANRDVAFFFLPDDATIEWLERNRKFYYINLKMRELKKKVLETGKWHKTGAPLRITNNETVDLYLNERFDSR